MWVRLGPGPHHVQPYKCFGGGPFGKGENPLQMSGFKMPPKVIRPN